MPGRFREPTAAAPADQRGDGGGPSSYDRAGQLAELELLALEMELLDVPSARSPHGQPSDAAAAAAQRTPEELQAKMAALTQALEEPSVPAPAPRPPAPAPQPRPAAVAHLRPGCPLLPPGQEALERCAPPAAALRWSPWERQSRPLAVGPEARAAFAQLLPWVESEVAVLEDASLEQEAALLHQLTRLGAS